MANKIVSIEVGIYRTKVCVVAAQKKSPRVYQAFVFNTPENAIEDGYIRDKEGFAKVLQDELKEHNVKEKNVIFTLSSSKIITREIVIPEVKENKIAGIVNSQAKDYFPMDISNYSITYTKMDAVEVDGLKKLKLLLVAVPDKLLNNYYAFAELAGLQIESFDYIGNSTSQFMSGQLQEDGIVVELDEQTTVISIISDKKLVFQRITPYGYVTVIQNMMNHPILDVKDEYEAFSFLMANDTLFFEPEPFRFPDGRTDSLEQKKKMLDDAYEDIREALNYHIRVVYTAIEYYQNQAGMNFKGKLYLLGRGTKIAGLQKLFEQNIPIPMGDMAYESIVNWAKPEISQYVDAVEFISTIGAVVHPIDIKPKDMKEREGKKSDLKTAYIVLGVSGVISVALVLAASLRYLSAVSKQKEIDEGIANLSYIEEVYSQKDQVEKKWQSLKNFEEKTASNNEQLGELITQLEKELPTTVTVESLSVNEKTVTLNVSCDVEMTAAALLINMERITMLTNLSIPSMAQAEDAAGNKVWKFSVLADYVGATTDGDAAAVSQ